jgi:hypothetical protein
MKVASYLNTFSINIYLPFYMEYVWTYGFLNYAVWQFEDRTQSYFVDYFRISRWQI